MTQPANTNRFPELASQAELDAEREDRFSALHVRLIWAGGIAFCGLAWWGLVALVAAVLW